MVRQLSDEQRCILRIQQAKMLSIQDSLEAMCTKRLVSDFVAVRVRLLPYPKRIGIAFI